ncbi:hypothetical protein EDB19DRAFT_1182801 [Suillus lakei]|nr:hypothetical protein EDB19DRAFT_1182801 [Suillus lakei]
MFERCCLLASNMLEIFGENAFAMLDGRRMLWNSVSSTWHQFLAIRKRHCDAALRPAEQELFCESSESSIVAKKCMTSSCWNLSQATSTYHLSCTAFGAYLSNSDAFNEGLELASVAPSGEDAMPSSFYLDPSRQPKTPIELLLVQLQSS